MKTKPLALDGSKLSIEQLKLFVDGNFKVKISGSTFRKNKISREFLEKTIGENKKIIYGVNTGFGPMADFILSNNSVADLQANLILSHAVGMGNKIKDEFVQAATLVRLNTLLKGYSGVSPALLKHLQIFINNRIIPIVPEHGAVGTSGDLVQLAHIALGLLGKGEVIYKNKKHKAAEVFKKLKLAPYTLGAKEGLSLINGTSMMSGIASLVCFDARALLSLSVRSACLALEIVRAYSDSVSEKLHALRPHPGQTAIAQKMRRILAQSPLIRSRSVLEKYANHGSKINHITERVQEIYSLRCVAQILGPIYDCLKETWQTTETEINSVTDNPIVDWESKRFLHGGNFHGDYIAVKMDQLKASLAKLALLSERRLNFFLNQNINRQFPPFLNLGSPGLTLGLQALQFVATSTAANSQTLSYPMNLHSIPTNGDNQDIVSMGTDAALITHKVLNNSFIVQAVELIALAQAVDFLKIQNKISPESKILYAFVRRHIKKIVLDRELQDELKNFLPALQTWREANLFKNF